MLNYAVLANRSATSAARCDAYARDKSLSIAAQRRKRGQERWWWVIRESRNDRRRIRPHRNARRSHIFLFLPPPFPPKIKRVNFTPTIYFYFLRKRAMKIFCQKTLVKKRYTVEDRGVSAVEELHRVQL